MTQADDAAFAAHIGEFIDLPEFARFMAVMVYLSDLDGILGPGQNLFLHLHPKSQQFQFIPWDQDHSWGQFNRASQEQRDKLSIHHPWQGENFFLERMFKVEAFKKLYLARLDEFGKTIFRPERIAQQVDQIAAVIRPAVQEESEAKLARFDKLVAGEALCGAGALRWWPNQAHQAFHQGAHGIGARSTGWQIGRAGGRKRLSGRLWRGRWPRQDVRPAPFPGSRYEQGLLRDAGRVH